jgi:hypothetical protein
MPHDLKGRKIERGDYLKVHSNYSGKSVGVVQSVTHGSETCNVNAAVILPGTVQIWTVNAKDCELVMKADGSDPE